VDEFVDERTRDHESEAAGAEAVLLAHHRVFERAVVGIADRGVRDPFDVEALARVGDAVEPCSPFARRVYPPKPPAVDSGRRVSVAFR